MSRYIMGLPTEPERIRLKTSAVLLEHHLSWAGLGAGESFVDFGCASGEAVRAACRHVRGGRVLGLDADPAMLAYAEDESTRMGLIGIEYLHATVAGFGSNPIAEATFDHAWSRFLLEYVPNPVEVIAEMTRLVPPGGRVTMIDLDGNCIWHHPVSHVFTRSLNEVMATLGTTGFDPRVGSKLAGYARAAGLVDVREQVEPYHWIVGRPDEAAAADWTRKIDTIRRTYLSRLAPHDTGKDAFFDDFLAHILAEDTMTWSLAYLVQGTKPDDWSWPRPGQGSG